MPSVMRLMSQVAAVRRELHQRRRELAFAVNIGGFRRMDVEHEQRHGDGEDAVAERADAAEVGAGDGVVVGRH